MTQKTKLEIIGPYTPEHEGPWVLETPEFESECVVHAVVEGVGFITICGRSGPGLCAGDELMNAREVPMAREFWVNEYQGGFEHPSTAHHCIENAQRFSSDPSYIRTIHVREVLPGEGA
ncbi:MULTISPECIES: hypothetical protein [Acetobacter]|uniref:hypothetical protein n=1 Tax=Acetobacter TaxID=434 RepID=UPI00376F76DE